MPIFFLLCFSLFSGSAWSCTDGAAAFERVLNAAADGKRVPSVNARVFDTVTGSSDELTEIIIDGNKLKAYKAGELVEVNPNDIKTMRAFIKDADGRRVHTFVTSPENGQDAVQAFFKGTSSGNVSPDEARSLGNLFKGMSEADQATLVGGIENKLRAGQQITESEFLIAVKGTPSWRTLDNAAPNLETLQKAFRSSNLDEALELVAKKWNAANASIDTQGRVARIGQLLGRVHGNRSVDALTDLGASGRLANTAGAGDNALVVVGRSDAPPAIRAPETPNLPAVINSGDNTLPAVARSSDDALPVVARNSDDNLPAVRQTTQPEPRVLEGEVMPREASVVPRQTGPQIEGPVIEGSFRRVDDAEDAVTLTRQTDNVPALPNRRAPLQIEAPRAPVAPEPPAFYITPARRTSTELAELGPGTIYKPRNGTVTSTAPKLTRVQKLRQVLRNHPGWTMAGFAALVLAGCEYFTDGCISSAWNDFDQGATGLTEEDMKNIKIDMKAVKGEDGAISCSWTLQKDGEDLKPSEWSKFLGPGKAYQFKWEPRIANRETDEQQDAAFRQLISELPGEQPPFVEGKGPFYNYNCHDSDFNEMPDNPCKIHPSWTADDYPIDLKYTARILGPNGTEIDSNEECKNKLNAGTTGEDDAPVTSGTDSPPVSNSETDDIPTETTPTPTPTPTPSKKDDCDTSSDSTTPWLEDDKPKEGCETEPAQRVIDPFNILQGNDGKKFPLTPPNPIIVPPSGMPPYVTPGYY